MTRIGIKIIIVISMICISPFAQAQEFHFDAFMEQRGIGKAYGSALKGMQRICGHAYKADNGVLRGKRCGIWNGLPFDLTMIDDGGFLGAFKKVWSVSLLFEYSPRNSTRIFGILDRNLTVHWKLKCGSKVGPSCEARFGTVGDVWYQEYRGDYGPYVSNKIVLQFYDGNPL